MKNAKMLGKNFVRQDPINRTPKTNEKREPSEQASKSDEARFIPGDTYDQRSDKIIGQL